MSDKFDSSLQSEVDQKNKKPQPGVDDEDIFKVPASKTQTEGMTPQEIEDWKDRALEISKKHIEAATSALHEKTLLLAEIERLKELVKEQGETIARLDEKNKAWKRWYTGQPKSPDEVDKDSKMDEDNEDFSLSDVSISLSITSEGANDAADKLGSQD